MSSTKDALFKVLLTGVTTGTRLRASPTPADRRAAFAAGVVVLWSSFVVPSIAQEKAVYVAKGSFEVNIKPSKEADEADGVSLGRFDLEKGFSGDLIGTSEGEMLTARTATEGSAGYVAIERFTGSLKGLAGTFVLQHTGTMQAGDQTLAISIVPDSGTGELSGISGNFQLRIEGGDHYYELEYSLGDG